MDYKGFKISSIIFGVIGFLVGIGSIVLIILSSINPGAFISFLSSPELTDEQIQRNFELMMMTIQYIAVISMLIGVLCLSSFILVVVCDRKNCVHRWHFIPGLIGSLFTAGTVVGLIYTIIAIKTVFTADVDNYKDDEANRALIRTPIIFFSLGLILFLASLLIPLSDLLISLYASIISLMSWIGMCFIGLSTVLPTYLAIRPRSHLKLFFKILVLVFSLAINLGLYFLFAFLLKNNMTRFNGDWKTIQIAIVSATLTSGLLNVLYFIFAMAKKNYTSYIYSLEISLVIALLAMILGNFISIYWVVLIQFVLDVVSLILLCKFIETVSKYGEFGIGGNGPATKYKGKYILDNGIKVTYEGGGNYIAENGDKYVSSDGGYTVHKD